MVALQGHPRPHHRQCINRRHRAPTAMEQPRRRRQARRRSRVTGRERTELKLANNPMAVVSHAVKSLRCVRQRTRSPEQHTQNCRRQAGEFGGECDKENSRGNYRLVCQHINGGAKNAPDRDHPALANFGTQPRDALPLWFMCHVQRGIHAIVEPPCECNRGYSSQQPEQRVPAGIAGNGHAANVCVALANKSPNR